MNTERAIRMCTNLLRADPRNPLEVEHMLQEIAKECDTSVTDEIKLRVARDAALRYSTLIEAELARGNLVGIIETAFDQLDDELQKLYAPTDTP